MNANQSLLPLIAIVGIIGAFPLFVVVATSFTKISVVLLIVRNAIGIQQTPPNIVIYAIAMALSFHIMQPVLQATQTRLTEAHVTLQTPEELIKAVNIGLVPLKKFMAAYSSDASREFFSRSQREKGAAPAPAPAPEAEDVSVLAPAFLLDELTRAFEIGLMLYLPFLAIDFLVSAVLIAMGMQMMSPSIVSTPLKILLFVLIQGWTRLFENLVMSYPTGL